jgi:DNA-binding NarL/FixJ family response regulator
VPAFSVDETIHLLSEGGSAMSGRPCPCGETETAGSPANIRVLVVDDHPAVRTAVTELLDDEDDLTVVGECENGSQVVEAVERLRPDVVLMDMSMPVMNGLAASQALQSVEPAPRIVMFTGEGLAARPDVAAAGADALVPKSARANALLGCLRTVVVGCGCCPYCL